jgi:ATP-dependent DNA helicase RecG
MIHPEYRRQRGRRPPRRTLTPIYPGTEGISQASGANSVARPWAARAQPPQEAAPARDALGLLERALRFLHCPPPDADQAALRDGRHPAQLRLALEELVAHQLSMRELRSAAAAPRRPRSAAGAS